MGKYILKRILIAIPVLIGITIIDYVIMCIAGSPLEMLQGPRVSEAAVEAKAIAMGLDQPIYVQYFVWLSQLLQGNMGYSIRSYQPVSSMIAEHLGPTLLLMGVSLVASLLIAIPAGIYSAGLVQKMINHYGKIPGKKFTVFYRIVASLLIFVGAGLNASLLWDISDVLMGAMTIINIPVIIILGKYAIRTLKDYEKQKKAGKYPVFRAKDINFPHEVDYWK